MLYVEIMVEQVQIWTLLYILKYFTQEVNPDMGIL